MFLQRVTDFVAKNQRGYMEKAIQITRTEDNTEKTLKPKQEIPERISPLPMPKSPHTLAPSPGKSFLDANTGQEMFSASIEADLIETKPPQKALDVMPSTTLESNIQYPNNTVSSSLPRKDEPADKGIPTQLMPDKMLANEEFYENLREGMKSAEDPVHFEPETHKKYSHHLGRAEFGTLKKNISNAASRDASADRFKPNVGSRHPSAEKRFNSTSKLSRTKSEVIPGRVITAPHCQILRLMLR